MSKTIEKLEKEITEDLNKILIKLSDLDVVKLSYHDEIGMRVPSKESLLDNWEDHIEDDFAGTKYINDGSYNYTPEYSKWLEENEAKVVAKLNKKTKDSEGVRYKESYESFNLSALKTILKAIVKKSTLNGDEMETYINQYYNSNCF